VFTQFTPRPDYRLARKLSRDYFVVVVEVEFRLDVVSPIGDTLVPLVLDLDESVELPLASMLDDLWLLVSVEIVGDGTIGVVDWVVEELEDDICAKAVPVIREATIVAARRVFIMSNAPWAIRCGRGSLAIHPVR
jgi:hypothetical protein